MFRKTLLSVFMISLVTLLLSIAVSCSGNSDNNDSSVASESDIEVVSPVDVSLSDTQLELGIDTFRDLSVSGGENFSWSSTDAKVASVDNSGRVIGVGRGECDIIVENEFGNTAGCHLTVKKTAFITIDDGPLAYCGSILYALKKENVKATFFVIHNKNTASLKRIHDEGHLIAMHTYTHSFSDCYRSQYSYYAGLDEMRKYLKEQVGVTTNIIRFPGGTSNTVMDSLYMRRMVSGLDDLGYRDFDWTVSSGDASKTPLTSNQVANNIIGYCYRDVEIILIHDKATTSKALGKAIPALRRSGYIFDTLDHYIVHSNRSMTHYEKVHGTDSIPCAEVISDKLNYQLSVNSSIKISATMNPPETTDYLRFCSDNPSIATVTLEGVVKGIRPGQTKIRAIASSGKEAEFCFDIVS